ncbi:hypothetical protein TrST_g5442 [Triparma strigata]|uniref:Uncharacterized protein n=1 Tax=Triparma strigata TaxID=1606541 RepID=A0A9W7E6Y7_9STRA|nr:hypothetical protein TrST_g5442 [Triparma strigata]
MNSPPPSPRDSSSIPMPTAVPTSGHQNSLRTSLPASDLNLSSIPIPAALEPPPVKSNNLLDYLVAPGRSGTSAGVDLSASDTSLGNRRGYASKQKQVNVLPSKAAPSRTKRQPKREPEEKGAAKKAQTKATAKPKRVSQQTKQQQQAQTNPPLKTTTAAGKRNATPTRKPLSRAKTPTKAVKAEPHHFYDPIPLPPPPHDTNSLDPTSSSALAPHPPPPNPVRPTKAYDMRSLRSQINSLHTALSLRCSQMKSLRSQNMLLWERIELYKSNVEENESKASMALEQVKSVGKGKEERRKEHFEKVREASKLRRGKGEELLGVERSYEEGMKSANAMKSKLEEVLEAERRKKDKVDLDIERGNSELKELDERKRRVERSRNLDIVEEKITEWWSKSSRGAKRAFELLKFACDTSKKIDRVAKRWAMFTGRKWVKLCLGRWKIWYERRVGHIKRKKPRNLVRVKSLMINILRTWRDYAKVQCRARWSYVVSMQRRFLYMWRTNIAEGAEERHERLLTEKARDAILVRKCFKLLLAHKGMCKLSKQDERMLMRRAAVFHRDAVFHRWQRKVLGIRLNKNFDSYALQKISSRSQLRTLKAFYLRLGLNVGMERIASKRLRREFFKKWKKFHVEEKRFFDLEYRADLMAHTVGLRRGIKALLVNVRVGGRERRADRFFKGRLFKEWRENARVAQAERVKSLVAVNHYFGGLCRRAFRGWKYMNGKADIFLMRRAGRWVKRVFQHWVEFVPLVRHEKKRDLVIDRMATEKFKKFVGLLVRGWRAVTRRRCRARKSFGTLKRFKDADRKRKAMGSWVVVWMRTKRAQNTVLMINSARSKSKIQELEESKGSLVGKQQEVSSRREEVERQLTHMRAKESELSLTATDTQNLVDSKNASLIRLKNEIEKSASQLELVTKDADALEVIENQRVREKEASERKLKVLHAKHKKTVDTLLKEKENLLVSAGQTEALAKKLEASIAEERKGGEEAVMKLVAQTQAANKNVMALAEEEAVVIAEQSALRDRIGELKLRETKVLSEQRLQQNRLSGKLLTTRQNEVNALRCRVSESERLAEEAVLLLREKEEEIAELQRTIARHQEGMEMKRLLQDSDDARKGMGLTLQDIGIGVGGGAETKKKKDAKNTKRRDRKPTYPKMKAIRKVIREDAKILRESERSILAIEEMGLAFDMATGVDVGEKARVVTHARRVDEMNDDMTVSGTSTTTAASTVLGSSRRSYANNSEIGTPVLTEEGGQEVDFLDFQETRTQLYMQEEVEQLEETIDDLQKKILNRLSGGGVGVGVGGGDVWRP